ncbi:MAG: recombination protein O N-terminal domain-containing protein [Flavobacteriales bacterium]|nr:recombination protein O N-terminal domain-containing protein [Flavobacteriales bacterium]MDW8409917.1 recombination protein O N-terminal domain-containing protein [Flavobacteriales bacterium]
MAVLQSEAIVLRRMRYGEEHLLVRALTATEGPLTVMLRNTLRGRRLPMAARLCYPGARLLLQWRRGGGKGWRYLTGAESLEPQYQSFFQPERLAQITFIAQCLDEFLPQDHPCEPEYYTLASEYLRYVENNPPDSTLPLRFIASLCRIAGIAPVSAPPREGMVFDLSEARWMPEGVVPRLPLRKDLSEAWMELFSGGKLEGLSPMNRQALLSALVQFITLHHRRDFSLSVPDVFKTIFSSHGAHSVRSEA